MNKAIDSRIKNSLDEKLSSIKASDDLIARTLARINAEREAISEASASSSPDKSVAADREAT